MTAVVGLLRSWKVMFSLRSWTRGIQYPWATPSISEVEEVVNVAWKKDRGGGASEDDWNTEVHLQLLKLPHKTSTHRRTLDIYNV